MYAQVEKPKEYGGRSVANSVTQKKGNAKESFGFVDNRPEVVAQRTLHEKMDKSSRMLLQRFNSKSSVKVLACSSGIIQRVTNPDTSNEYTSSDIETLYKSGDITVEYSHRFDGWNFDKDPIEKTVHNYSFKLKRGTIVVGVLHLHFGGDPKTEGTYLTGSKIKSNDFGSTLTYSPSSTLEKEGKGKIP